MFTVDDLHASGAAASAGQEGIASSPSARSGCTSWQSPHFGQRGWLFWTVALLLGWVSLASSCFSSTQLVDNVPCGPALCFDLDT